jgi:hypothetical protein
VRVMQNWGMKKAEPKTPHFLSLNQDIVDGSQEQKCELKYVIYIFKINIDSDPF